MKLFNKLPVLVFMAIITLSSCTTDSMDSENVSLELPQTALDAKDIEIEILNLINDHRVSLGLNTLNEMELVKSVAYSHTDYMIVNDVVSHANFYTRSNYLKQHAGATKVTENVAYGYSSAAAVVRAWLNSESHKENLEGDFTDFDVSAEANADGRWYFTNIFIKK
ncbi:Allergen V5/Tpx-1 family protein [Tamlana sedimentorum]|uniref:Allergen V5/Tpx-1 family protein n=1 Tax=Neotamlana sedimentorum TaxID=1435349 RepID=A0A0D7W769_9FLAO|nr:CAP domain-containing protein [Tamlana sedimentorum]KJD34844.1 Allergen V5/Tpx-1 family protein [Tamlana sedimentorum]